MVIGCFFVQWLLVFLRALVIGCFFVQWLLVFLRAVVYQTVVCQTVMSGMCSQSVCTPTPVFRSTRLSPKMTNLPFLTTGWCTRWCHRGQAVLSVVGGVPGVVGMATSWWCPGTVATLRVSVPPLYTTVVTTMALYATVVSTPGTVHRCGINTGHCTPLWSPMYTTVGTVPTP